MSIPTRLAGPVVALALAAASASAQTSTPQTDSATRPAFATADGDTGLWYVATAEVLARGTWSASGYRVALNYVPGFSNVADFPLTFGGGVARNVEVFGSLKVVTRIDRDLRTLFQADPQVGGVIGRYPYVWQTWTGNRRGDLVLGAKVNVLSQERQKPAAVAIRGSVKIPTGDKDAGVSTGKADAFLDLIVSKELARVVELSGSAGGAFRSSADDVTQSNGIRWGVGAGFPSRSPLRFTTELSGEKPFDNTITVATPIVASDKTQALGPYTLQSFTAATLGLTLHLPNGFFAGFGMTRTLPTRARGNFGADSDPSADFVDYQVRIGYHPGVRRYVPPPPPSPPPAPLPPPPPPANRAPSFATTGPAGGAGPSGPITATKDGVACDPCVVEPGQTITLTANAQDPDGDTLTYRWTAPTGTFSNPTGRTTDFTAPDADGPIPVTVTVSDGKGGTTSATTTVQVRRPPPIVELRFEDVYFDFDRSSLRAEALRLLDDAVAKMQANPEKTLIIEGHTCNIGTAEYNLALGERRARAVQTYLTSRGIPAGRLETRSYGEEQPKFDNGREETRRLNRRAALVITVQ